MKSTHVNEWQSVERAAGYLERADNIPHRSAGESVFLDELPARVTRVLDLGCGDGRLLDMVLGVRPGASGVAVDFSPHMLDLARTRFEGRDVRVINHNLDDPLPALGSFDLVVSSFAIHHLVHERKRQLYEEIWRMLDAGGAFCHLEHVASASPYGHARFLAAMGTAPEDEDRSNKLLDVETQLAWLRQIGFVNVDCYWKWRELALMVGHKGAAASAG
jgi:SAM-dependent methyltransferase